MEILLNWDTQLLLWVNSLHTPFLDVVMSWVSNRFIWIPLYAVLLYLLYKRAPKELPLLLVSIVLLILLIDQGSVHLFKNVFERLRPCHTPEIEFLLHVPDGCGGRYGFVSSHAANSFGLATFVSLLLRKKYSFFKYGGLYFWAFLIDYSRMYLAAHYFGDVLVGSIFGSLVGYLMYHCFLIVNKRIINYNCKK